MMQYEKLFSSGKIGSLKLKNRLVMTAMGCGLANTDGTVSEEMLAYYEERAKGGVGLIITEVTRVNDEHGVRSARQICASKDMHIPGLEKLAKTIHKYDARIFLQLHHPGFVTNSALNGNKPLLAPSNIGSRYMPGEVRSMSTYEIESLVEDFAAGAIRAKKAGIDGVEIHASHFYLIHEFLSPYFNKRTDKYGGTLENRTRFLKEIIFAIREAVGADYPLGVRLSVEDYISDGGYHLDQGVKIAKYLEEWGVDIINVTASGSESDRNCSIEPVSYKQGWRKNHGEAIKRSVSIPVCMVGVLRKPDFAEKLLEEGIVDFVGSGRNYLADPEWANKAMNGKEDEINHCVACLRCIDAIKMENKILCSVNPTCGEELKTSEIPKNGDGRTVVVVGAGPAGLEAARVCAEREFKVILFEKNKNIGGQVYLATNVPHKDKMKWFIDYKINQCKKLNVDIRLGSNDALNTIKEIKPFAVIDATGSVPIVPGSIQGVDNSMVYTPVEILDGSVKVENESIAVIGSGMTGLETAEFLAEKGNAVTVIEMAEKIAPGANPIILKDVLKRLTLSDVVFITNRKLTRIEENRIFITDVNTEEEYILPINRVVLSLGVRKNLTFAKEITSEIENVIKIGDASTIGRIREAVLSGYEAARGL